MSVCLIIADLDFYRSANKFCKKFVSQMNRSTSNVSFQQSLMIIYFLITLIDAGKNILRVAMLL